MFGACMYVGACKVSFWVKSWELCLRGRVDFIHHCYEAQFAFEK